MTHGLSHIALVTSKDPEFRRRGRQGAMRSPTYGRESRCSAYDTLTQICEGLVRKILDATMTSSRRRILRYREKCLLRFNELDAVLLDEEATSPHLFIEVKTSVKDKIATAKKQLQRPLSIARSRWHDLSGAVIWVDTSSLYGSSHTCQTVHPITPLDRLVDSLHRTRAEQDDLAFRLSLEELLDMGADRGYLSSCPVELREEAAVALTSPSIVREPMCHEDSGFRTHLGALHGIHDVS